MSAFNRNRKSNSKFNFRELDEEQKRFGRLFFDTALGFGLRLLACSIIIPVIILNLVLKIISVTLVHLFRLLLFIIRPRDLLTEEEEEELDEDE